MDNDLRKRAEKLERRMRELGAKKLDDYEKAILNDWEKAVDEGDLKKAFEYSMNYKLFKKLKDLG